jgi:hypothetical protein
VDRAGDTCIEDQNALTVTCYALSGTTLTSVSTTPLPGASDPVTYTFTGNERDIRTADSSLGGEPAGVVMLR